jgi:hypothetical protein
LVIGNREKETGSELDLKLPVDYNGETKSVKIDSRFLAPVLACLDKDDHVKVRPAEDGGMYLTGPNFYRVRFAGIVRHETAK